MEIHLSETVKWVLLDDSAIILDLDSGRYFGIKDIGYDFWKRISGYSHHQLNEDFYANICNKYDYTYETTNEKINGLITELKQQHILQADNKNAVRKKEKIRFRLFTVFRYLMRSAFISIVFTRILLRFSSFRKIYSLADRILIHRRKEGFSKLSLTDTDKYLNRFCSIESVIYNRRASNDCLHRSLALFFFLVANDMLCQHIIGVREAPLEFHAWVSVNQKGLLNDQTYLRSFIPISTIS